MSEDKQLGQRALDLRAEGADPFRVDLLQRAQRFKRSWIEMAEGLVKLRVSRAYEGWGYRDIYSYCADELLIKRRTVDKLSGSYQAVQEHAPAMLRNDGFEGTVPALDCVDYFARATGFGGGAQDKPAPDNDVVEQLHHAVFSEGQPLRQIRQQFDQVLFPKSAEDDALTVMKRASATSIRLRALLADINGLDRGRHKRVAEQLEQLEQELSALILAARDRAARNAA